MNSQGSIREFTTTRPSRTVTGKLVRWLAGHGYIDEEVAEDAAALDGRRRSRRRRERARRIALGALQLSTQLGRWRPDEVPVATADTAAAIRELVRNGYLEVAFGGPLFTWTKTADQSSRRSSADA